MADELIRIKRYTDRWQADLDVARLSEVGITASVSADDAGGQLAGIGWGWVSLFIKKADLQQAREVLEIPAEEDD